MQQLTKKVKHQIRELISILYQRELQLELEKLDQHFNQWRKEKISPFQLSNDQRITSAFWLPNLKLYCVGKPRRCPASSTFSALSNFKFDYPK